MMAPILFVQTLFAFVSVSAASITLMASFSQNGIIGSITFAQNNSFSIATIMVNLQGMEHETSYMWYVHQYPFLSGQQDPCASSVAGGHYDPQGLGQQTNYTMLCAANQSLCEMGDLTGRHGPLTATRAVSTIADSVLNLFNSDTIIGRSLTLNWNETQYACTNIHAAFTPPQTILYAPFRMGFVGAVYFRPFTYDTMTAFADLHVASDLVDFENETWQAHMLATNVSDCTQTTEFLIGNETIVECDLKEQEICESGDLVGRVSQLEIYNRTLKVLYMDTTSHSLSLSDIYSVNHSIVIVGTNETTNAIACGSIRLLAQSHAVAQFNTDGVVGTIEFTQASPFESTIVTVVLLLAELNTIPSGFQIHELNVADKDADCNSAGGLWGPVAMAPSDRQHQNRGYSYSFGSVYRPTSINQTYSDSAISLYGKDGIIGRSIVMYFANSSIMACANILHKTNTWLSRVQFNTSEIEGFVTFIQPAGDPYATTTIIIDIHNYSSIASPSMPSSSSSPSPPAWPSYTLVPLPSNQSHNEHLTSSSSEWATQLHDSPPQSSTELLPSPTVMAMKKREAPNRLPKREATEKYSYMWSIQCLSNSTNPVIFSPYGPSQSACSPSNQLMCAVGDLKGKHGVLALNRAVFTDTNLPMAGPHAVIGSFLCIQIETNAPNECVQIPPASIVAAPNDIIITVPSKSISSSPVSSNMMITAPLSASEMITSSLPSNVMVNSPLMTTSSLPSNVMVNSPLMTTSSLPSTSVMVNSPLMTTSSLPSTSVMVNSPLTTTSSLPSTSVMGNSPLMTTSSLPSTNVMVNSPLMIISSLPSTSVMVNSPLMTTSSLPSNVMVNSPYMITSSLPSTNVMVNSPLMTTSSLPSTSVMVNSPLMTTSLLPSTNVMVNSPLMITSSLPSPSCVVNSPLLATVITTSSALYNMMATSSIPSSPSVIDYHKGLPTASAVVVLTSTEKMIPLVAGCVGGGLAVIFIAVLCVTILCCCKCCRSTQYVIRHPQKEKIEGTELGITAHKQEPEVGVPCYRALYNYSPISVDDLQLKRGDIVTLVQATTSSEWWMGTVGEQSGWFPKICVQYFDIKTEERERQKVGTITPRSEWKNKLNRSVKNAYGIKEITTVGQGAQMLSSSSGTKPLTSGPNDCPGSPENGSEVIVNMAAVGFLHEEVKASQHAAAGCNVMAPGKGSNEVLNMMLQGGHYFETKCSQLSLEKHEVVTSCSNLDVAWNRAGETRNDANTQPYGRAV